MDGKEVFGYGSQQARELAPELWGPKGGKPVGVNYSTGHKRPAIERNVIDTSESTCANDRGVDGWHFRYRLIRAEPTNLQIFASAIRTRPTSTLRRLNFIGPKDISATVHFAPSARGRGRVRPTRFSARLV